MFPFLMLSVLVASAAWVLAGWTVWRECFWSRRGSCGTSSHSTCTVPANVPTPRRRSSTRNSTHLPRRRERRNEVCLVFCPLLTCSWNRLINALAYIKKLEIIYIRQFDVIYSVFVSGCERFIVCAEVLKNLGSWLLFRITVISVRVRCHCSISDDSGLLLVH